MPAAGRKGGGKFANVKTGKRADLSFRPRSAWEANIARLMEWKEIEYHYEQDTFYFPGERTTNRKVTWDFTLAPLLWMPYTPPGECQGPFRRYRVPQPYYPTWLEVKGMLPQGGRLDRINLTLLKGIDDDSRVKAERFLHYYPHLSNRVWYVGQREYKWLSRRYGLLVPHWEGLSVPKARKRATP